MEKTAKTGLAPRIPYEKGGIVLAALYGILGVTVTWLEWLCIGNIPAGFGILVGTGVLTWMADR